MRAVGIVAEYNPFHNGHAFQIIRARELTGADAVVCVMSGSFVQRGAPAIADKWVRAEMALAGGADLVVELPCYYALSSAQDFAFGAVSLLDAMGCVESLCFGSESGDIQGLTAGAHLLEHEPQKLSECIKSQMERGAGYPAARSAALRIMGIDMGKVEGPNDILATEYLRALLQTNSKIRPVCVTRVGTGYHDTLAKENIASATALRQMLKRGEDISPYLPAASYGVWKKAAASGVVPVWEERLDTAVLAALRRMDTKMLAKVRGVGEGLESRIVRTAMRVGSVEELIALASTKRYTKARIARIIWAAMLGIDAGAERPGPDYLRVLAMNQNGMRLLAQVKDCSELSIVTKAADYEKKDGDMFALDCYGTDLVALGYPEKRRRVGRLDFTTSPVVFK